MGAFAVAGFEGAGPASDLLGVVGTVNILFGTRPITPFACVGHAHFRQGQDFKSSSASGRASLLSFQFSQ